MRSKHWIAAITLAGLLGTSQGLATEARQERPPDPTGGRLQAWHDTMWEWSERQAGRVTVGDLEIPEASEPEPPDQEN